LRVDGDGRHERELALREGKHGHLRGEIDAGADPLRMLESEGRGHASAYVALAERPRPLGVDGELERLERCRAGRLVEARGTGLAREERDADVASSRAARLG